MVFAALALRVFLAPYEDPNYTYFIGPWFEHLDQKGFAGLGDNFANYNVPYLYVLYLGTLLPADPLLIVKVIATLFDLSLAAGIAAIVWRLRRNAFHAASAGAVALILPEVFLNSALQGQADSTYTSFLVWSAYFVVRRRDVPAWVMFGLAFSFKLQAMFMLPWILVALVVQRHRIRAVLIGMAVFFMAWIPAMIAGRDLKSLARIYRTQADGKHLTREAANLWQWIPDRLYDYARPAGLAFALAVVALLALLYLRRAPSVKPPELWLLQVGAGMATAVPFVLPQMHDRFFFAASVFTLICATLLPRSYVGPLIALQFTALIANSVGLVRVDPVIPLTWVAGIQLVTVTLIVGISLLRPATHVEAIFAATTHPRTRH